ncbi:hypothetical protein Dimus_013477 [Dionaea muscipula]
MNVAACKVFYKNLTVSIINKKEVARTCVRGVKIELDGMTLAGILGVPGNTGICEYIKDVWDESVYCKPLEITKKFTNDIMITVARRVKSTEMKPFQRFLHFLVMKIVVPRFGKRDTTSFMDLTYMDHLMTRRLVNLPRLMLRHMTYVIFVENHELPNGDWLTMVFKAYNVPLHEIGGIRRRDDENEAPTKNVQNEEIEDEGQINQEDFDWEAVFDEVEILEEEVEKEAEVEEYGSGEKYFDAVDEERSDEMDVQVSDVAAPAPSSIQKRQTTAGVDPLGPVGSILDSDF